MIESPLIKELLAERDQKAIIGFLRGRFGEVPPEITTRLGKIFNLKKLDELIDHAARCPDLEAFRAQLLS
jgi:hypothetical protein